MRPALTTLLLLAFVAPARGEILELPVPGLLGTLTTANHGSPYKSTVAVQFPAPSVIHSISLRMRGYAGSESFICNGEFMPGQLQVSAMLFETEPFVEPYVDFDDHPGGSFSTTRKFERYPAPDYTFLLDGAAKLQIGVYGFLGIECALVGTPATVRFDEVTLLIDAEFPTPAPTASWGRVKSIYR